MSLVAGRLVVWSSSLLFASFHSIILHFSWLFVCCVVVNFDVDVDAVVVVVIVVALKSALAQVLITRLVLFDFLLFQLLSH